MNDVPTPEAREARLEGMGCKRKRVEDIRFTQGKGNYVDDLKLPGMLHGDFVRSQYGHAKIKRIDAEKAKALPGVVAVITAEELKPLGLHWMPTLAGDVQAVLADGLVSGARKHHNHIFEWSVGDKAATDEAFNTADVTIKELISYQRVHPSPLETCQCVASFDKIRGELTVWGTFQAPHIIRTVASLISKIPEHKIHVIAPDIGGGSATRSARTRATFVRSSPRSSPACR